MKRVIDESMACPSWCSLQAVALGAAGGTWKCNAPSPRLRPGLRVRNLSCSTFEIVKMTPVLRRPSCWQVMSNSGSWRFKGRRLGSFN